MALDQVVQLRALGRRLLAVLFKLQQQLREEHGVLHLALLKALRHRLIIVNLAVEHHGDLVQLAGQAYESTYLLVEDSVFL